MSRHHLRTARGASPVLVVMGYDRPLNEFFLQLWDDGPEAEADEPAYSSLDEPAADWRDIATVVQRLVDLGVAVPRPMIDAVVADSIRRAGNRIVEHTLDGRVTELSA
ncbi:MAG: hypothetical protein ACOY7P_18770 [Pseudomonadota bacterium]